MFVFEGVASTRILPCVKEGPLSASGTLGDGGILPHDSEEDALSPERPYLAMCLIATEMDAHLQHPPHSSPCLFPLMIHSPESRQEIEVAWTGTQDEAYGVPQDGNFAAALRDVLLLPQPAYAGECNLPRF